MTDGRQSGRYNLQRLGWHAFEDLCLQIMRGVLGETCTRFPAGRDAGRDGWFRGVPAGKLAVENGLRGDFVVQCKHSSMPHHALEHGLLRYEKEKVRALAAKNPLNYILLTNRRISAGSESQIRAAFESIPGVSACLVLGETWIEDTIDANARLLRLVPRLYGIGDLSQIVSSVIERQSIALLEDLVRPLRTFVPTESYRRAERALHERGWVVLVGPPASGKSAIAANLCMVNVAQDSEVRVLRIEHAEQFKNTWSPADAKTIYWVDDVFGETTLDDGRLYEWSAALDKVEAAARRGARIIFCTRDYILAAAGGRLKKAKVDTINDAEVRVDVTNLFVDEKEAILYNHIKDGDITKQQKQALKRHLPGIARLVAFSPELARRLGNARFHKNITYDGIKLAQFFEQPVEHLRDVIHGLSGSETAALAVCLLSGNRVPDPVPDDALAEAVLSTYGVSMPQVRQAFESLNGSLLKRVRVASSQTWEFHHPSMIDALQQELATKSSQLVLYLQSAKFSAVLRDTTTVPPPANSHVVFVASHVYGHLIARIRNCRHEDIEPVALFLADRASDEFLAMVERECQELLDRCLSLVPEPTGAEPAARLAVRLSRARPSLMNAERTSVLMKALRESWEESGHLGFLHVEGVRELIPEFVRTILTEEVEKGFEGVERFYDWMAQDLSEMELVDSALSELGGHVELLSNAARSFGLLSAEAQQSLQARKNAAEEALSERAAEIEDDAERPSDYLQDEWKEQWREERDELETGRFADVDE
jgi:hypothetical protein